MGEQEITLWEVLEFKEWKSMLQNQMLETVEGGVVISLGMNIPGRIKVNSMISSAFFEGIRRVQRMLLGMGVLIVEREIIQKRAGYAGIFLIKNGKAEEVKKQAVLLETEHVLGRLFDIDVIDSDGTYKSRKFLGMEERQCFLCNGNARVCMRTEAHSHHQLQNKVWESVYQWQEAKASEIGTYAYESLLEEVYTTPKPGLVDLYSCGAHKDMDVNTFERSAKVLRPYFVMMAHKGLQQEGNEEELFLAIRNIGKAAEKAMYVETKGANTHKGLIFTLGIFCAATGRVLSKFPEISETLLKETQLMMTKKYWKRK